IHAEVLLKIKDEFGRIHPFVLNAAGETTSGHEVQLKTLHSGELRLGNGLALRACSFDLRVNPRVTGGGCLYFDSHGMLDDTYRPPGSSRRVHLHKEFHSVDRTRSGSPCPISADVQERRNDASSPSTEVMVSLTMRRSDKPDVGKALQYFDSALAT